MIGIVIALCIIMNIKKSDFILVQGGEYRMGSDASEPDEYPAHNVKLDSFYICKHEVTVGEFREFTQATGYKTTLEKKAFFSAPEKPSVTIGKVLIVL